MQRSRSSAHFPFVVALTLFAAACGGDAAPLARPHELRLEIVHGKGLRDTVRAAAQPADLLQDDSVVVRVFARLDARAGAPVTSPPPDARIPPVEVLWRTLEPWCTAQHSTTPLGPDRTAANRLRMPTVAGACRLVAEGVADGVVFAADTAVAGFAPGPIASFSVPAYIPVVLQFPVHIRLAVFGVRDEHGNAIGGAPGITISLAEASNAITAEDTLIRATAEGVARATVRGGAASRETEIWGIRDVRGPWRLSWACHDAALPDGTHADSAHYLMADAEAGYGSLMARGVTVRFVGTLVTRTWIRGEPVHETSVPYTSRFAALRPGLLEWAPGQTALATGDDYAGGSLCDPGPQGSTWTRSSPVLAERL